MSRPHDGSSTRPALQALDSLWRRVHSELELYTQHVQALNDSERLLWARSAKEWLQTEGVKVCDALRSLVEGARPNELEYVTEAIQAAQELVDVTHEYLTSEEAWDTIRDWSREILPRLKKALERNL